MSVHPPAPSNPTPYGPYGVHEILTAPARSHAQLWRLGTGILIVILVFLGLNWALQALAMAFLSDHNYLVFRDEIETGATPAGALFILLSFGFLAVATLTATNHMHKRGFTSLIGPQPYMLAQFTLATMGLVVLGVVLTVILPAYPPTDPIPNLQLGRWLWLLPLSLIAVLIQTASEELLFRGYLQQQLAARFNDPRIWLIVPSVLFGLLHYRPELGPNAWLVVGWASIFGLAAADLTARSGTLGPAMALHFVTNVGALLVTSADPDFSGLALYLLDIDLADPAQLRPVLLVDIMALLTSWLAVRVALRR